MKQDILVPFRDYAVVFSAQCGGFPEKIVQKLRGGREEALILAEKPWMELRLGDGSIARPSLPADAKPNRHTDGDGTQYLQFNGIPWTADGGILPDWTLDLEYELHSDGVGFLSATLVNDGQKKPDVEDFRLCIPMDFGEDQNVLYHYWMRPQDVDGGDIQSYSELYRNELSARETICLEGTLLPVVGFDFGKPQRLYRRIEWFMEDQVSLEELNPNNTSTRLDWTEKGPELTYSFAAKGVKRTSYPYVWTNRFGFVLTQVPKVRDKAPLRLYHEMDGDTRYPSDDQIRQMADEGADMLVLHECWRKNMRNGGAPYQEAEFRRVIDTCHRYQIRVAPYIRGNEDSVRENRCAWFDWYFQKDYDGLYVDYGGPHCYFEKNGVYPGGRVAFHQHYHTIRSVRERVGSSGIIILHIGPFFGGAVVASLVDGFCSGECEQGKMIETRQAHAYYAKTSVGPGSLWTAAFPSYRTEKIRPYAAVSGQFPHVSLGVQIPSSSLANPLEPGNVTFARPLWRYFGLMQGEREIGFANDICEDSLQCDSPLTGVGAYTMADGSSLLLIGNFADHERLCTVSGAPTAQAGQVCKVLYADDAQCRVADTTAASELAFTLPAFGVVGVLQCRDNGKWQQRLAEFAKPYPEKTARDMEYDRGVQAMRKLRFDTLEGKQISIQMHIPFSNPTWEKPLWDDLYETTLYRLFATSADGEKRDLGYLSKAGLTREIPSLKDRPWPTESSPWISLHTLLPAGQWDMEIHGYRVDQDYYSLAQVNVKTQPEGEPVVLRYLGELDEDRSRLTFRINLQE